MWEAGLGKRERRSGALGPLWLALLALLGLLALLATASSPFAPPPPLPSAPQPPPIPAPLPLRQRRQVSRLVSGQAVELVEDERLGLWTTAEGRPLIWAFWHDPAHLPAFIRLGLASLACHNPQARLLVLSPSVLPDWVDHVHPAFELLSPTHQADYARARLLHRFGGLYVDADSVAFAPVASLFDKLAWYELVNISWGPDRDLLSVTTMGPMRAHSDFTRAWITDLHLLLDIKLSALQAHANEPDNVPYPVKWSEMLRGIVKPIAEQQWREQRLRLFSLNGERTFGQLLLQPAFAPDLDLSSAAVSFSFADTELLMYHNSRLGADARGLSLSAAALAPLALSELLRLSFARCRQADPARRGPQPHKRRLHLSSPPPLARDAQLTAWILRSLPSLLRHSL